MKVSIDLTPEDIKILKIMADFKRQGKYQTLAEKIILSAKLSLLDHQEEENLIEEILLGNLPEISYKDDKEDYAEFIMKIPAFKEDSENNTK